MQILVYKLWYLIANCNGMGKLANYVTSIKWVWIAPTTQYGSYDGYLWRNNDDQG